MSSTVVDLTGDDSMRERSALRGSVQVQLMLSAVRLQLLVDDFKRECPRPDPRAGLGALLEASPPLKRRRTGVPLRGAGGRSAGPAARALPRSGRHALT